MAIQYVLPAHLWALLPVDGADVFVRLLARGTPYPGVVSQPITVRLKPGGRLRLPIYEGPTLGEAELQGAIELPNIDVAGDVEISFAFDRNRVVVVEICESRTGRKFAARLTNEPRSPRI